jgi:hypothetical protein
LAYQLRRVYAINIWAPKLGQCSARIASLDLRGGVLALGANGVGKTTMLRMIPMFYGATPQQILKGAHRNSMVAYTLRDPSSAMVFEYERESEDDLRCVVMYCLPGEDSPQFYFLRTGFDESFFVDENGEFVTREEFKPRMEASGQRVSPALRMHQYRSVILRDRAITKEAKKLGLWELATEFSLGPAALHNLDHIAVAMATEKISYRDLLNIVFDQVTDHTGSTGSEEGIPLKQGRDEVSRWIEARQHMASLLAKEPEVQKLRQRIANIKDLDRKLCTLHVAVKATIEQLLTATKEKSATKTHLCDEVNAQITQFNAQIESQSNETNELVKKHEQFKAAILVDDSSHAYFDENLPSEVLTLHEKAPQIRKKHSELSQQLIHLQSASLDAISRAQARSRTIEAAAREAEKGIASQREGLLLRDKEQQDQLNEAEFRSLQALQAPARVKEIKQQTLRLTRQEGELGARQKNPQGSDKTQSALATADDQCQALERDMETKEQAVSSVRHQHGQTKTENDEALARVAQLEQIVGRAREKLQELQARLEPDPGTLMAFLREREAHHWEPVAKVLNDELLSRKDLQPVWTEETAPATNRVQLDGLGLDVSPVFQPDWVSMSGLRKEIGQQQDALVTLGSQLREAESEAKKSGKTLEKAELALSAAGAQYALTQEALRNARNNLLGLRELLRAEVKAVGEATALELASLQEQLAALNEESQLLTQRLELREQEIREDFLGRRKVVNDELGRLLEGLKDQGEQLEAQKEKDLANVEADLRLEQKTLGVNTERIDELKEEEGRLLTALQRIAETTAVLQSWKIFEASVLPGLPARKRALQVQGGEIQTKTKTITRLRDGLKVLKENHAKDIEEMDQEILRIDGSRHRLAALHEHELKNFLDFVSASVQTDWNPADLEARVRESLVELETSGESLRTEYKQLRGELLRHGGAPADWLELRERDLPDEQTVRPHQYLALRADFVSRWFEPAEHGEYLSQLNHEMKAMFGKVSGFIRDIKALESSIDSFNSKLQKALGQVTAFESFGELRVEIRSRVGKLEFIKTLEQIEDRARALFGTRVSFVAGDRALPSEEDTNLMRAFRDSLQTDSGFRVNLREQVEMICYLRENKNHHIITNQEQFQAVSSNGLTALITAMFLMGFVQMVRNDAPVYMTWLTDEVGRFDSENMQAYLDTLQKVKINVVCAAPTADPSIARHFKTECIFEPDGSILTALATEEGEA